MSDRAQTNQNYGGNIGQQGTMTSGTVNQTVSIGTAGAVDFAKLSTELAQLHAAMVGASIGDPNLTKPADEIAAAKDAADKKQESGVLAALKSAGKIGLDFAIKVGEKFAVDLTVAWMKKSLGMP